MDGVVKRKNFYFFLLLLIITLLIIPNPSLAADEEEDEVIPLGTESWKLPEQHMIYVQELPTEEDPAQFETKLDRNYPTSAEPLGNVDFGPESNLLFEISSKPATETMNISSNISVDLFVSLTTGSSAQASLCTGTVTSFDVDVSIGGNGILQDTITSEGVLRHNEIRKYSTDMFDTNLLINEGDSFELAVAVSHPCAFTRATLWWGGLETTTGIVIQGDLLKPNLTVEVDDNRIPHMKFIPYSPWGMDDYDLSHFDLFVWGPVDEDVYDTNTLDQFIEHFDKPDGNTTVEGNRTALTWVGKIQLSPGHHLLKSCIRSVDMSDWDTSSVSKCPDADKMSGVSVSFIQSSYRFGVDNPDSDGTSATMILCITWFVSLIGFIGMSLRGSGIMPWPVMVIMLLMTLALIPWAAQIENVGKTFYRENGPLPNFDLLTHSGDSVSLGELLDGKDALVLGVYQIGSPNSQQQHNEFKLLMESEQNIAIAQLATGNNVRSIDLDFHSTIVNGSWPLLMDIGEGEIASQFPTGSGDAILIIDKSGTISWLKPSFAGKDEIIEELDKVGSGGSYNSITSLLGLILIAGIPGIFYALPNKEEEIVYDEENENALFPGSIWFGTILGGAFGAALIAFPQIILSIIGLSPGMWWVVELILSIWILWHGIALIWLKNIPEIKFLVDKLYPLLPQLYRQNRGLNTTSRDVEVGVLVGWIAWTIYPMFYVQMVTTPMITSLFGILMGLFALCSALICLGLNVLFSRVFGASFGKISTLFGNLSEPYTSRYVGIIIIPIGIIMAISSSLHLLNF
ncbi:MAG TPA: hypothetical protein QF644_03385 [Candidatus Poseidoniaceae archaeon]|nr:hypothetical protein [Candidatus Poseidoniaceae archaeon]